MLEVEAEVVLALVELVDELVELVDVVTVVVETLVLLVEVELVEVLEVLELVELVDVLEVEVEVVKLSTGSNCPTANLYCRPLTPAEAKRRLVWLMAWMKGCRARDSSFSWPVLSLYPQTPVLCSQIVQEPIF